MQDDRSGTSLHAGKLHGGGEMVLMGRVSGCEHRSTLTSSVVAWRCVQGKRFWLPIRIWPHQLARLAGALLCAAGVVTQVAIE